MDLTDYLSTLPNFLAYLAAGILLTTAYMAAYVLITPQRELTLIREGSMAAAFSLSGAMVGFVLPLASVISHSVSLADVAVWGFIALVVQLGAFLIARLLIPGLPSAITANNVAAGGFAGAVALAAGLLNAACLTW